MLYNMDYIIDKFISKSMNILSLINNFTQVRKKCKKIFITVDFKSKK